MLFPIVILIVSCKKSSTPSADDTTQQVATASDQYIITMQSDQVISDANIILSGHPTSGTISIAGATIDSSNLSNGVYIINYHGTDTRNMWNRTGAVTVQITGDWNVPGSVLTLVFNNFTVTRTSNGNSITFNGNNTITNISAATYNYWHLPGDGVTTIEHKVQGTFTIDFGGGIVRPWNIARTRKIVKTNSLAYQLTISQDTTVNGYTRIESWGTDRAGELFTSALTKPIVINSSVPTGPLSGYYQLLGLTSAMTINFGVDTSGVAYNLGAYYKLGAPYPYGYKLSWVNTSGGGNDTPVYPY
ncbi:MAG TPA: hypothetical protein VK766_10735 [Cytophagaceae bacterium]|nr:hypothetical protein [Cytophagaceae bacterium]